MLTYQFITHLIVLPVSQVLRGKPLRRESLRREHLSLRRAILSIGLGRRWCVTPCRVRCSHWSGTRQCFLSRSKILLLLLGDGGGSSFDQGILDGSCRVRWENRSWIQRSGYWLFPSPKHFVQLPSHLRIDQSVCIHENLV